MADRKISDLTALTTPAAGDYLPIVDVSEASASNKNKRITIEELLRGAPDGTAAAPSIAFESDPNTGIYSPGADAFGVVTGGTDCLRITSAGNVGIGTTGPEQLLHIGGNNGIRFGNAASTPKADIAYTSAGEEFLDIKIQGTTTGYGNIRFSTGPTPSESACIDSSGRLLVGTSSDTGGALLQVNDNRIRIATAKTPSSASDTGTAGEICWDADYIYVCTATNTWKRTAIATW